MVVKGLSIVLDNATESYSPGQTVSGKVSFWITEKCRIQGVELKVDGNSKVRWSESHCEFEEEEDGHERIEKKTEVYQSEETYFQHSDTLMNQNGDCEDTEEGNHEYPFSFQLPEHLPPSFDGKYGKIRYVIKAFVYGPADSDYNAKLPIVVKTVVDLNNVELAKQPVQATDSKTIGFWCCATGPITADVSIDRMGYVADENITFSATVDNKSGKTMRGSKVQLIQAVSFHARGKIKKDETVLCEQHRGPFDKTETWNQVAILIPEDVPSELHHCTNISINHHLQFSVDPGTFSFDLKIPLNIIIGNVPLAEDAPKTHSVESPPRYEEIVTNGKSPQDH